MMICVRPSTSPPASRGRLWLLSLVAVATVSTASAAHAASPRETEAAKLFFGGQYADALKIYVDLAVATGDPIYMCEIGRCYSRMGRLDDASRNIKDCLAQAKLTPKKKREFQALQTEIEAARKPAAPVAAPVAAAPPAYGTAPPAGYPPAAQPPQGYPSAQQGYPPAGYPPAGYPPAPAPGYGQAYPQQQPGYPPAAAQRPPTAAPSAPALTPPGPAVAPTAAGAPPAGPWGQPQGQSAPVAVDPTAGAVPPPSVAAAGISRPAEGELTGSAPKSSSGGSWMMPAAYVAGSVGVLGVLGGLGAGYMAKTKFDDVSKEYNDAKYKNGKTFNTLQYLGYGVGAAGIGAGIVLMILAPSSSERAAGGVTFVASPESFGLAGTF